MRVYLATGYPGGGGTGFANCGESMRLYLAESNKNVADVRNAPRLNLRVLLSYHYYRDTDLRELFGKYFDEPWPDLFLDSGAFSAKSQGAEIDVGEYAEWVQKHEDMATVYANLDVIGNPTATAENQRTLEREGLQPLPVFHVGSPWSALEGLVERYDYIALGGMVGRGMHTAKGKAWLAKCFRIAGEDAGFHGFGVTTWSLMRDFPWRSVDSSSWGSGFRYGTFAVFDERRGNFVRIQLRDKKGAWEHRELIRSYGFDLSDFAIHGRYNRAKMCAISAAAYMRAEKWLRERGGAKSTLPTPTRAGSERHGQN